MAVVWRTPGLLAPGSALFKVPGPSALISLSVPCSPPRTSARSQQAHSYSLFLCLRTLTSRDREERSDSEVRRGRRLG